MDIIEHLRKHLNPELLTDFYRIQGQFDKAADLILNNCKVEVDDYKYHIVEIEFYYYREGLHEDPFVHKHDNQKEMGVWYFHNVGQDLTFGDGLNYGGILIRGLLPYGSDPHHLVDGPVRSYEKLFNAKLDLNSKHNFGLIIQDKLPALKSSNIYKFPRAGMFPKGKKDPGKFILLPYRYMLYPCYSKIERHVLYLHLKYFENDENTAGKLIMDGTMLNDYEDAFSKGSEMHHEKKELILTGVLNMNVENKCKLMGYYKKHKIL